jgi:hypothetical protein
LLSKASITCSASAGAAPEASRPTSWSTVPKPPWRRIGASAASTRHLRPGGELLAGPGFKQAGEDPPRRCAYFHAPSPS